MFFFYFCIFMVWSTVALRAILSRVDFALDILRLRKEK